MEENAQQMLTPFNVAIAHIAARLAVQKSRAKENYAQ